ncbi:oxidoreductase family, NAD-binding Rossmann fold domain protein [Kockovaella imperatae]|uniref:Oxidoreductase family, NAD-binding Rossmann fold domain protein n=1 Tax=Kockovaella imperatae TaxID=4999 RepID=A0A1Y1UQY0_9TREE|nr:oxidoreductase family, NAD-binding Rossmann fold domain protein [Kockovaella imperatae]ORX39555.1 oxidoreductase family, NAD-binding Rossmann fold domain protein [Kockovaella imperatae]
MVASVILVGAAGFGSWHLANQRRLNAAGRCQLIALVDPAVKRQSDAGSQDIPQDAPLFNTLTEAVESVGVPNIVIVSTPIHIHALIAKEALLAGANVYLEKPPFACMADFEHLLCVQRETGLAVQVGFQSLGSTALEAFDADEMKIGHIKAVRAMGLWLRKKAYWNRSPWVGKRSLDNVWVMDGVATNALSHAVVTGLRIAGARRVDDVLDVQVEGYRANPVDSDDTISIRITLRQGPIITAGLTLCASEQVSPVIEVVGERGTAVFEYTTDDVQLTLDGTGHLSKFGRTDLTENLLDHLEKGTPLLSPLISSGAYMRVLDAIRLSGEPHHIERRYVTVHGAADESYPVIERVEEWIRKAADADSLLSTVGTPWAFSHTDKPVFEASLGDRIIFQIQDGKGTPPSSSARPYLHPVTSIGGVEVTATRPSDHDWHLGVSFAVPDVDGVSFWGGGTYVHGKGYVMLNNHGRQELESSYREGSKLLQTLAWRDPGDSLRLREHRRLEWEELRGFHGWELLFETRLEAVSGDVSLGSPGTNGRVNAGYGGFNWRLPRCSNIRILSADGEGEETAHGSTSSWIAWSARFQGRPGACGDATLVLIAGDSTSSKDPWIVREQAYPGLGSAVAWKDRVEIPKGMTLTRSFRIAVIDGLLDRENCESVATLMRR